jgi:uncharacterized protein YndB with AHSA1/START domain
MENTAFDWSQFSLSVPVKASLIQVYTAFSTQQGMESWFLRYCGFRSATGEIRTATTAALATDRYEFKWWGWPEELVEFGEILEANGEDLFAFTFTANDTNDMKVKVTLRSESDQVRVTLHQYDIPVNDKGRSHYHLGCTKGWTFYLTNLKSMLEGGIDLRNKDENIKAVVNC